MSVDSAQQAGAGSGASGIRQTADRRAQGFLTQTPPQIVIDLPERPPAIRSTWRLATDHRPGGSGPLIAPAWCWTSNRPRPTRRRWMARPGAATQAARPRCPPAPKQKKPCGLAESRQASALQSRASTSTAARTAAGRIVVDLSARRWAWTSGNKASRSSLDLQGLAGNLQKRWDNDRLRHADPRTSRHRSRLTESRSNTGATGEHSAYQTDERCAGDPPCASRPGKLLPGPTYSWRTHPVRLPEHRHASCCTSSPTCPT